MMKVLNLSIALLFVASVMTGCGNKDQKENTNEATEPEKELATEEAAEETSEAVDYEALAMKGLKAYESMDLVSLKAMAYPPSAMNMTEEFIQDRNEEYMQNWDGKIHTLKFRNDFGMQQALAYYADKEGSEEDEVYVYIVQKYGDKWYPSTEFDHLPRAEFEALPDHVDEL